MSRHVLLLLVLVPASIIAVVVAGGDSSATHGGFWHTTEIASVATDGSPADESSNRPRLSFDGNLVVFDSGATTLVPGASDGGVFLRNRAAGTTELLNVTPQGLPSGWSQDPDISADGRLVAFESVSSELVAGDSNSKRDIFLRDLQTDETVLISLGAGGQPSDGDSFYARISANGRFVSYSSEATNLVDPPANGLENAFVFDRISGVTTLITAGPGGTGGNDESWVAAASDDGLLAVSSKASDLVPGDVDNDWDAFLFDTQTGAIENVVASATGQQIVGSDYPVDMTPDGRFLLLRVGADAPSPFDSNGLRDAYLLDRQTGVVELISRAANGSLGDGNSSADGISGDGRFVAFESRAGNLVPGDSNGASDVFVFDRGAGVLERVSVRMDGSDDPADNFNAGISGDGKTVAFGSVADLVPGDANTSVDILVATAGGSAPTPTAPAELRTWGDVDCQQGVTIGDAQKIARYLVALPASQANGCPQLGASVLVGGSERTWGDLDCQSGLTIGDAQKTALNLIQIPITKAADCPSAGSEVPVES